ncbi:MAG: dihydrodipicolinate synthase family protein [Abitibacteriaceae bacterium]|nr:dihydrodipicolinate synthase family protein [Abditibacteriaceae bacterium]MBV9865627.1 dihydrodipicolinate synthase family protein [Abditibacteriaceae bacterium]
MNLREHLLSSQVIPAHPLALTSTRTLDERHQRALTRYYLAAGAGGLAVGVHTTQFEIRAPQHGLLKPVLELASQTIDAELNNHPRPFAKIAGICGRTEQAVAEAELATALGYHAGLLSLAAWRDADDAKLLSHCRTVAAIIPLIGFYLQPAVGGRVLPYSFWRAFSEIPEVVAIKIAPFNRYQTLDVVRAVADAGRDDIALYTGNDDNIVLDLLTPFEFPVNGQRKTRFIVGGLLGHWAVWTKCAVELLDAVKAARQQPMIHTAWLTRAAAITDANAALFDVANGFGGCIPGIHEVLRRQGLLAGTWCLNPQENLSPGQSEEIDRVLRAYPELTDNSFVQEHLDQWLA